MIRIFLNAVSLITGLIWLGLGACTSTEQKAPAGPPTNTLTAAQWRPLRLTQAQLEPERRELHLTGTITVNQDQVVKVFPLVGGHLEQVKVDLGDYVRRGQVLAVIQSGDIADLKQQAVAAQSQLAVAQKNLQVTQDMANSGLSSQRDLISAQQQVQAAKGEVSRVNERQRIMGSANGSTYVMKAPVDGFVVEKKAAQGMELRPDDPDNLFTISNLDHVWVMADVYESDLANVRVGETATVTTLAYPDQPMTGRIDKVFNVLDPDSKTEKVRITLPNRIPGRADYPLKPDMFANVTVSYADTAKKVAIPAQALVFDNSRYYVVVVGPKRRLQVREVTVDRTVGPKAYVGSGLQAGETVVWQNQLLAYSALNQ